MSIFSMSSGIRASLFFQRTVINVNQINLWSTTIHRVQYVTQFFVNLFDRTLNLLCGRHWHWFSFNFMQRRSNTWNKYNTFQICQHFRFAKHQSILVWWANKGPCPFPVGNYIDNCPISTNLALSTSHFWVMGIQVCSNEGQGPEIMNLS